MGAITIQVTGDVQRAAAGSATIECCVSTVKGTLDWQLFAYESAREPAQKRLSLALNFHGTEPIVPGRYRILSSDAAGSGAPERTATATLYVGTRGSRFHGVGDSWVEVTSVVAGRVLGDFAFAALEEVENGDSPRAVQVAGDFVAINPEALAPSN